MEHRKFVINRTNGNSFTRHIWVFDNFEILCIFRYYVKWAFWAFTSRSQSNAFIIWHICVIYRNKAFRKYGRTTRFSKRWGTRLQGVKFLHQITDTAFCCGALRACRICSCAANYCVVGWGLNDTIRNVASLKN